MRLTHLVIYVELTRPSCEALNSTTNTSQQPFAAESDEYNPLTRQSAQSNTIDFLIIARNAKPI